MSETTLYFPVLFVGREVLKEYQETGKVPLDCVAYAVWEAPYTELTLVDHKNCQNFTVRLPDSWDGKPLAVKYDDESFEFFSDPEGDMVIVYDKEGYVPKFTKE
jgi:hypothetical protein